MIADFSQSGLDSGHAVTLENWIKFDAIPGDNDDVILDVAIDMLARAENLLSAHV